MKKPSSMLQSSKRNQRRKLAQRVANSVGREHHIEAVRQGERNHRGRREVRRYTEKGSEEEATTGDLRATRRFWPPCPSPRPALTYRREDLGCGSAALCTSVALSCPLWSFPCLHSSDVTFLAVSRRSGFRSRPWRRDRPALRRSGHTPPFS